MTYVIVASQNYAIKGVTFLSVHHTNLQAMKAAASFPFPTLLTFETKVEWVSDQTRHILADTFTNGYLDLLFFLLF